jgi:hypothetical protein
MSNEAELRFAAALGMASFQAQSLEHSLVTLYAVTFITKQGVWDPKVRTLMDTRYTQTLGKLIRDAANELHLTDDLTNELEDALKSRNWVTHHFFREYGAVGLSPVILREATQRLETIWSTLQKTAIKVHELAIERQVESGRSRAEIQAGIEHALSAYLNEKENT